MMTLNVNNTVLLFYLLRLVSKEHKKLLQTRVAKVYIWVKIN